MDARLSLEDRWAGSLVGQCVGDALGFPVEGHAREVCEHHLAEARSGRIHGRGDLPFGQYTDDSQLARELLESFEDRRRFDPADYAARIAAIFAEDRIVGRGRATEQAAHRLLEGVPWQESGTPPPSAGNGSAMRAGPVGLIFAGDADGLVRAACEQGRITHRDPRCSAGAVAIAGGVALALAGEVDPPSVLDRLVRWTAPVDARFASALEELRGWLALEPVPAAAAIARAGEEPGAGRDWPGISPFVIPSVLWALYAFLRTPGDYLETVSVAIAPGGDVDTTAAMAGALSGAHVGLAGVPESLSRHLTDRGTWGEDELIALARRCCRIARGG